MVLSCSTRRGGLLRRGSMVEPLSLVSGMVCGSGDYGIRTWRIRGLGILYVKITNIEWVRSHKTISSFLSASVMSTTLPSPTVRMSCRFLSRNPHGTVCLPLFHTVTMFQDTIVIPSWGDDVWEITFGVCEVTLKKISSVTFNETSVYVRVMKSLKFHECLVDLWNNFTSKTESSTPNPGLQGVKIRGSTTTATFRSQV